MWFSGPSLQILVLFQKKSLELFPLVVGIHVFFVLAAVLLLFVLSAFLVLVLAILIVLVILVLAHDNDPSFLLSVGFSPSKLSLYGLGGIMLENIINFKRKKKRCGFRKNF